MRPLLSWDGTENKHLYAPLYWVLCSPWEAKPAAWSLTPHMTWLEVHQRQENCTWTICLKDNGPCSLNVKHCMNNIKITLLWALHVTRHCYTESSPNSQSSFWSTDPRKCNKASAKNPHIFILMLQQKSGSGLWPSVTGKYFCADLSRLHEKVV